MKNFSFFVCKRLLWASGRKWDYCLCPSVCHRCDGPNIAHNCGALEAGGESCFDRPCKSIQLSAQQKLIPKRPVVAAPGGRLQASGLSWILSDGFTASHPAGLKRHEINAWVLPAGERQWPSTPLDLCCLLQKIGRERLCHWFINALGL